MNATAIAIILMLMLFFASLAATEQARTKPGLGEGCTGSRPRGHILRMEIPASMMIYKTKVPTVTPELVISKAKGIFGLSGALVERDEAYIISVGNRTFCMLKASGIIWYADYSKLWNVSITPRLLPTDACREIADIFLRQYDLMPDYAVFKRFGFTNLTAYNTETKDTKQKLLNVQVIYGFEVGGYPFEGPGAQIIFYIGDLGEIVGFNWGWRDIEEYHAYATLPLDKVEELLEESMPEVTDYEVLEQYLAYYAEPGYIEQEFICPFHVFKIRATIHGREFEFTRYIPATEFSLAAEITSPAFGSEFEEGEPITFSCQVFGGTPPYSYEWASNVDGFLSDQPSFTTTELSLGRRGDVVLAHTITLTVKDANGQSYVCSVLVKVVEKAAPPPAPAPELPWLVIGVAVGVVAAIAIGLAVLFKKRAGTASVLSCLFMALALFSGMLLITPLTGQVGPESTRPRGPEGTSGLGERAFKVSAADDDGIYEVGVEWVNGKDGLPNSAVNAEGFYDKVGDYSGWHKSFDCGDEWAWERDFKAVELGGADSSWVDDVDMVYYNDHGNPYGISFNTNYDDTFLRYDEARWGDKDLEWIVLDACSCLEHTSSNPVWRWGPALRGLHIILGFHSGSYNVETLGWWFATLMGRWFWFTLGLKIIDAWFTACPLAGDPNAACLYATKADDPWNPPLDDPTNDHLWGFGYVCSDPYPGTKWWVWLALT